MTTLKQIAWIALKEVVLKFLGNQKHPNLGCSMSLKVHFLYSHRDYFSENLDTVSEERGES